jgi:DNA-binding NtrC family response regulator
MLKIPTEQELIGTSATISEIRQELCCAAGSDAKVLITGETGVGKEAIAGLIHNHGWRRQAPFVTISCGIPSELLESVLFGHVQGSFADAQHDARGWLERADKGTLFVDDIDCLSPHLQNRLVKFLEDGEVRPLGETRTGQKVDVRIIAASSRNLYELVLTGIFREDLYYRLNTIHLTIPPLRERKDDIPLLVGEFMRRFSRSADASKTQLPDDTLAALVNYSWPGNVRELKSVVEGLVNSARSGRVPRAALPAQILASSLG